ncbi:MAG: hypothetical protein J0M15_08860 [Deltaproteobacteria bacterium]|nr:hypothetical protein [Deltaproteobacteria bacterium]
MSMIKFRMNIFLWFVSCLFSLQGLGQGPDIKLQEWQKYPLNFFQVSGERFFVDTAGFFAAGTIKSSSQQESDKVENSGVEFSSEYGFTDQFAGKIQMAYQSGSQKNSTSTTKIEGLKDVTGLVKWKLTSPVVILIETGIETSPEALKINALSRTVTASSGGTKVVIKGGAQIPHEKFVFGGGASYKHFLQREMEITSVLGSETAKIDGGNQITASGFFEFGTGLRTGLELKWLFQNRSSYASSALQTTSDFELEYQQVTTGAYLKIPAGEKIQMYIRGDYNLNPSNKRGSLSYDKDELFEAKVGLQAVFF